MKYLPGLESGRDIAGSESLAKDASVVFIGTFALMRHIQSTRRWRPGGWCHFGNLACATYYAHFGPFLLNRNYTLLPIAEAPRLVEGLFRRHGRGGRVFVRPSEVDKLFTGCIVDEDAFQQLLRLHSFDGTRLVLVAEPRPILDEWRLFVAAGRVIAASQYREGGEIQVAEGCPDEVRSFAERAIRDAPWTPEPLFVMDVCRTEEGLHLVELGGFSCSGPCDCDLAAIVRAGTEAARQTE